MKNNTKIYNRFKGVTLEDCDCRYCLYYGCLLYTSDERPIRLHRLGEEYTKERITQRLIENRDNIDFEIS